MARRTISAATSPSARSVVAPRATPDVIAATHFLVSSRPAPSSASASGTTLYGAFPCQGDFIDGVSLAIRMGALPMVGAMPSEGYVRSHSQRTEGSPPYGARNHATPLYSVDPTGGAGP